MAHKTGAAYKNGHIVHGCANAMYLPKVIKYNAKVPEAALRYAEIAKSVGLTGTTSELVDALCQKIRDYNAKLNIPTCIKNYENGMVPEDEFKAKLHNVCLLYTSSHWDSVYILPHLFPSVNHLFYKFSIIFPLAINGVFCYNKTRLENVVFVVQNMRP